MRKRNITATGVTFAVVVILVLAFAIAAMAWPRPDVSGDCEGWHVTETAPASDWDEGFPDFNGGQADYFTIDGVDGKFGKGETVFVADDSDDAERAFTVRWFKDKVFGPDQQLDVKSRDGARDLSQCETTTTTVVEIEPGTVEVTATCDLLTVTADGFADGYELTYEVFVDSGFAVGAVTEVGFDIALPVGPDGYAYQVNVYPATLDVISYSGEVEPCPPPTTQPPTTEPPVTEPPTTEPPTTEPPTTEPPAQTPEELPFTGADTPLAIAAAVALLATGGLALRAARER